MTDAEVIEHLEGIAASLERQGLPPDHCEAMRRGTHALRVKGQLVEALEQAHIALFDTCKHEAANAVVAALQAAKETP